MKIVVEFREGEKNMLGEEVVGVGGPWFRLGREGMRMVMGFREEKDVLEEERWWE